MKQLTTAPVFNATAKTLDFTSVGNFIPGRLLGTIDATAGQILFNPAAAGYGGSWSGNVLTLECGTVGLSSSDAVLAFFDDGQGPALEAGGNLAAAAASLSTAVGSLSAILTALGSPFQVGGSIGNASFGATQSGAWSVGVSGALPAFATTPAVAPANQAVGSANVATAQASVGTSAALIVAARNGGVGTGRVAVTIYNNGSTTVYLGGAGVTASTGIPLVSGAAVSINTTAALYGVASAAGQMVGVLETY
jgi:hypothetical protein